MNNDKRHYNERHEQVNPYSNDFQEIFLIEFVCRLNDRMRKEANSASSTSKIVFDNENNLKLTDENSSKRTRISTRKRSSSSSISQVIIIIW